MVRAKFYVNSVTQFANGGGTKVELRPVYSSKDDDENKKFWEATPSGLIEMFIKSGVAQFFVVGQQYYVDFSPASSHNEN